MKKILIAIMMIIALPMIAGTAFAWERIDIEYVSANQNGDVIVSATVDGEQKNYFAKSDHLNKKEIYSTCLLAATLNKSVKVKSLPDSDGDGYYEIVHLLLEF